VGNAHTFSDFSLFAGITPKNANLKYDNSELIDELLGGLRMYFKRVGSSFKLLLFLLAWSYITTQVSILQHYKSTDGQKFFVDIRNHGRPEEKKQHGDDINIDQLFIFAATRLNMSISKSASFSKLYPFFFEKKLKWMIIGISQDLPELIAEFDCKLTVALMIFLNFPWTNLLV
jgi:hypothetical protein